MKITQNGKDLDKSLYNWDESTKTFSSNENNLVLDFSDTYGVTFKTGSDCTFKTGSGCTFKTGPYCIFKTGSYCTFKTSYNCTFDTGFSCAFDTGFSCTFKTSFECVVVRRDIYEVIELKENETIKLKSYGIKGFTIIDEEKK